jgi:hypothetical protein
VSCKAYSEHAQQKLSEADQKNQRTTTALSEAQATAKAVTPVTYQNCGSNILAQACGISEDSGVHALSSAR